MDIATATVPTVHLPDGVELHRLATDGTIHPITSDLADGLPFIDDEQRAHYLIGSPSSGPTDPAHATLKIGVVAPHSAFTPHAHGAEHVVLSLGHASCTLLDRTAGPPRPLVLRLPPGHLVRIPPMVPHAFGNTAGRPLLVLAANTGLGIADADYAVTAAEARRRADRGVTGSDWTELAADLDRLGALPPTRGRVRDAVAAGLRALAERLEAGRPGRPA